MKLSRVLILIAVFCVTTISLLRLDVYLRNRDHPSPSPVSSIALPLFTVTNIKTEPFVTFTVQAGGRSFKIFPDGNLEQIMQEPQRLTLAVQQHLDRESEDARNAQLLKTAQQQFIKH